MENSVGRPWSHAVTYEVISMERDAASWSSWLILSAGILANPTASTLQPKSPSFEPAPVIVTGYEGEKTQNGRLVEEEGRVGEWGEILPPTL